MNRFMTISIASTIALGSIAGHAFAAGPHERQAGLKSHDTDADVEDLAAPQDAFGTALYLTAYSIPSSAQTDTIIRNWKGGRLDVVPVASIKDEALRASVADRQDKTPRQVAALQAAIGGNTALARRLKDRNISIDTVVDVQPAHDGAMIFYVR